ncbi:acido-empty-quinoprotein group A [Edaphobacter sp. 12200R-103]|uniref:acido-empty-quinoprotein group A n=1 Tax=Edaphobacter sp. 12200R-103 TaxID=2703788 RepID=UPI00138BF1CA|nr:acido-empty-quinoprotein group A [Edaphobacter sp. 12200R-103]QHS51651.1 acido-empty-quinoprotein group A [Edaphobacter sp. 12200R-103]
MKKIFSASLLALLLLPSMSHAQEESASTSTAALSKLTDSWPTYNGDYSGRRYSSLAKINTTTVKQLSLAWTYRIETTTAGGKRISATPLEVDGILYFTVPSHVWAVDARTGRKLWQFDWASKGGEAIGNRGAAVKGDTVYFETEDCNLVAIDRNTGKEKWHAPIGNPDQFYFGSVAPVIVKNHVMVGVSGDDFDIPGYIEAHDPETGALQWRWYTHPEPGTPEAKTWPNDEAMTHGGGMTWVAGTYDPELNLYYFGTGNAQPVINGLARPGANLFTSTICALNPDTGKLVWYFQPNPHDTHDWDAVQTPVLFDGIIKGQKHKLLAQASRNGWFFVLDRTNGKNLLTTPFAKQNWTLGVDDKGSPIPNPEKMAHTNGSLLAPNQAGAANWYPPSFSPLTGLFYVPAYDAYSVYYIYDNNKKPEGWAGNDRGGWSSASLRALDYKTGKVRWDHKWPTSGGRSGILTTAGNVLFTGDTTSNLVAFNATTGAILWHAGLGNIVTNGPITFELDGLQYVVAAAGDTLYAFNLR